MRSYVSSATRFIRCLLLCLIVAAGIGSALGAQTNEQDTARLGLTGSVKEVTQKRSSFSNRYGKWSRDRERLAQKLTFDRRGRLLEYEEYDSNSKVSFSWTRSSDGAGSSIDIRTSYQNESVKFDGRGQIIEKYQSSRNTYRKWAYVYDKSGNIVLAKFYNKRGAKPIVWTATYNASGNPIEVRQTRANGTLHSSRGYSYGRRGRLEKQTADWHASDGKLESTWTYSYDTEGRVVESKYSHASKGFTTVWEQTYSGTGNLSRETFYTSYGLPFVESRMDYDFRGNRTLEIKSGIGVSHAYRAVSEYDSRSRIVATFKFDLDGKQMSRETFGYSPHGDLVEKSIHNPDNSLRSKETFVYEYDRGGNWVVRKKLTTHNVAEEYDKPVEIVYRTISYH